MAGSSPERAGTESGRGPYLSPSACVSLVAGVPNARNGGSRERGICRTRTRARGARARARRGGGGKRYDRPRRRRRRHWQDAARLRARESCPPRRVRGAPRALDRSRRDGAALPADRRGPASARRTLARRRTDALARSCRCSRRRWPCSPSAPLPHPCCSCSRTCTGPIPRRSISPSSSRTTSTAGRFCSSPPTARTSRRRRSA